MRNRATENWKVFVQLKRMSMTRNESSTDLTELFEYDEFDSSLNSIDQNTTTASNSIDGIPLSVELSEAVSAQQNPNYVKAPEIFLRIDGEANTSTASTTTITTSTANKTENNPIECDRNEIAFAASNFVELQYENEFDDSDDDENDRVVHSERISQFESENEQILFEGNFAKIVFDFFCFVSINVTRTIGWLAELKNDESRFSFVRSNCLHWHSTQLAELWTGEDAKQETKRFSIVVDKAPFWELRPKRWTKSII